jgi:hypothetical protein
MNALEPQAARAQLDKILASDGFVKADRLCRFLRFTAEAKLNGDDDQIKEYLLGREVFDRRDDYDPRLDPIVRVEARRLRSKLDDYYAGPGLADPVRIDFPKGSYVPLIQTAVHGSAAPASRTSMLMAWLGAAAFLVFVAAALIYRFAGAPLPMIVVVPELWVWTEKGGLADAEEGLAELLTGELANSGVVRVIAWPSIAGHGPLGHETRDVTAALHADQLLVVSVKPEPEGVRATLFLVDGKTDRKLWFGEYAPKDFSTREAQREVAREAAADLVAGRFRNSR